MQLQEVAVAGGVPVGNHDLDELILQMAGSNCRAATLTPAYPLLRLFTKTSGYTSGKLPIGGLLPGEYGDHLTQRLG